MLYTASHWRLVDRAKWRWKFISPREVSCKRTGIIRVDERAMDMMTEVRVELDLPFYFGSIYRSPLHNAAVGGAPLSRHKVSDAFDPSTHNLPKWKLYDVGKAVGFRGFGFYRTFLHMDLGPRREWGRWRWEDKT